MMPGVVLRYRSLSDTNRLVVLVCVAVVLSATVGCSRRGGEADTTGAPVFTDAEAGQTSGARSITDHATEFETASTAPEAETGDLDWSIPERYRGEVVRNRVRYFPHKLLALTFDDGPDERITSQILDALAEHGARATFFVLGRQAKTHPELLQRIVAEGHALGNHSYSHPQRTTASEAQSELDRTDALIADVAGQKPTVYRPPYGIVDGNLTRAALALGYAAVLWTISSADTRPIDADTIARNVIYTPNPGDIVLMHDGAGHQATADAVPRILRELGEAGFEFVTMPELLRAWDTWQAEQ
jgi:peptidoglycan/xylan/chitin deacetylase (PgdA/CDA1 family)